MIYKVLMWVCFGIFLVSFTGCTLIKTELIKLKYTEPEDACEKVALLSIALFAFFMVMSTYH